MVLDAVITPKSLSEVPALARAAEAAGISAVWTTETQHNPFLPLPLVAEHSARLGFGTGVAIGFGRSPLTLAHASWDLAAQSGGRFRLGLGTQVRAHIERRFGLPWPESPAGKLRELVLAIRAIWHSWQTGERLNFRGEYFKLTLMTPFFNPGPIATPDIPIFTAGVNPALARLAGEAADGFHVHPFHTPAYLREVLRPALAEGAARAAPPRPPLQVAGSVFVITRPAEREPVRRQLSFYASTPSYLAVMAHHGWQEAAAALSRHAARGEWEAMPALISDDMLAVFAVEVPMPELGARLRGRYAGLLDRVSLYRPFEIEEAGAWQALARGMEAA
jgi:probable F420-dependent oxidoreductase